MKRFGTPAFGGGFFLALGERGVGFQRRPDLPKRKAALPGGKTA